MASPTQFGLPEALSGGARAGTDGPRTPPTLEEALSQPAKKFKGPVDGPVAKPRKKPGPKKGSKVKKLLPEGIPELPQPEFKVSGKKSIAKAWLAFQAAERGISFAEVGRRLGYTGDYIARCVHESIRNGDIIINEPMDRVEFDLIPLALDGLKNLLQAQDPKAIIETAKGTIFPIFKESKGVKEVTSTVLAIDVKLPDGSENAKLVTGHIVGRPKLVAQEGEIESEDS